MGISPKSKCSITVPFELYVDIDLVASVMGVSKSALVVSLLRETVCDMATLAREVKRLGYLPDVSSLKRLRGKSIDLVSTKLSAFQAAMSELDVLIAGESIRGKSDSTSEGGSESGGVSDV